MTVRQASKYIAQGTRVDVVQLSSGRVWADVSDFAGELLEAVSIALVVAQNGAERVEITIK